MARRVFFSFHYERDAWRAGQVRNCNLLQAEDQYGFLDAVDWQSLEVQGRAAIERWIEDQMDYTSVTVVLIGGDTAARPWVQHEIVESWNRGNGIVGVRIHNIKDQDSKTEVAGANPLDRFKLPDGTLLSSVCRTYDWVLEDGRDNLGEWVDEAFNVRAGQGDDEVVEVGGTHLEAKSTNFVRAASAPVSFAPRSPWCS
jgi:hypothetical protein